MSIEIKFNSFKEKYSLDDDAIKDLLIIFNETFIELAHKILSSKEISPQEIKKYPNNPFNKKWATKIAAEYASDNGISLEEFDKEKVTKKDIDEFIKNRNNKALISEDNKKNIKTKIKCKCNGINKSGEPCNQNGTTKPEGSDKFYCFRHSIDWKNYEISSDSDLEEEPVISE